MFLFLVTEGGLCMVSDNFQSDFSVLLMPLRNYLK